MPMWEGMGRAWGGMDTLAKTLMQIKAGGLPFSPPVPGEVCRSALRDLWLHELFDN